MVLSDSRFSPSEESVLLTLLYSDIFDFPMTRDELWRFLISEKKISFEAYKSALQTLGNYIVSQDGYYCLSGREETIQKRKKNILEVKRKLRIARRAAFYLSHIPTIKFIGLSGGLAMEDASADDDIDFFIITQKNTLFMTRLLVTGMLEWKNMRRKRGDSETTDRICVNLFMDESRFSWSAKKRDLYIAHEIAQVKPLFEREETYKKFLSNNTWVKNYLPNSYDEKYIFGGHHKKVDYFLLKTIGLFVFIQPFERIMQVLQQEYMKTHRTTEHISKTLLSFHPNNYRAETLEVLRSKCRKLGLLTNF